MTHEHKCRCDLCESGDSRGDAMAAKAEWKAKMLAEHGWFAEIVGDSPHTRTGVSLHTHGLAEMAVPHKDLEVVLPLEPKIAHGIIADVVGKIKEGEKFEVGKDYGGILADPYKVRFVEAEESGRPVLRLILPDEDGNLDRKSLPEAFEKQYP